jgi:hypothetical protein
MLPLPLLASNQKWGFSLAKRVFEGTSIARFWSLVLPSSRSVKRHPASNLPPRHSGLAAIVATVEF